MPFGLMPARAIFKIMTNMSSRCAHTRMKTQTSYGVGRNVCAIRGAVRLMRPFPPVSAHVLNLLLALALYKTSAMKYGSRHYKHAEPPVGMRVVV